jgi:hypothetical protein
MEKPHFNKFYRVFKNDTAVTEVSFNDFRRVAFFAADPQSGNLAGKTSSFPNQTYSLLPEKEIFYGYDLKTHAMEMAKAGALKHIDALIAEGPESKERLYQYRLVHYDDLNINLTDSNIRKLIKLNLNK